MMTTVKTWKNFTADACSAPAYQSASMTETFAMIMDTAMLAVSFLLAALEEVLHLAVRIILPKKANP